MRLSYRQAVRDIHIVKQQVGLDDDLYRDVVEQVTGKRSVKGLPLSELENVLVALRRFQSAAGRPPTRKSCDQHASGIAAQQSIIPHLIGYLGWKSWKPVGALCKRLTGWDDTRKCSTAELRKVIIAMVQMIERNHATGKRVLSESELLQFRAHTRRHQSATKQGENHVHNQPQPG